MPELERLSGSFGRVLGPRERRDKRRDLDVAFVAGALATTAGIVLGWRPTRAPGREAPGRKLSLVTNMGPSTANVRLCGEF